MLICFDRRASRSSTMTALPSHCFALISSPPPMRLRIGLLCGLWASAVAIPSFLFTNNGAKCIQIEAPIDTTLTIEYFAPGT